MNQPSLAENAQQNQNLTLDIDGDGELDYLTIGRRDNNSEEVALESNLNTFNLPLLKNVDFELIIGNRTLGENNILEYSYSKYEGYQKTSFPSGILAKNSFIKFNYFPWL